jgi:long-chain acyl-CoA synthetase
VAAVVVPLADVPVTADELRDFVGERLASFKVPSRIAVWTEPLPRNPAGKVLKRDLRDRFGA